MGRTARVQFGQLVPDAKGVPAAPPSARDVAWTIPLVTDTTDEDVIASSSGAVDLLVDVVSREGIIDGCSFEFELGSVLHA